MSLRRLRGLTPERDQRRRVLLRDCFSLVEKDVYKRQPSFIPSTMKR